MGKWFEQTLHQRGYIESKLAHKKIFIIMSVEKFKFKTQWGATTHPSECLKLMNWPHCKSEEEQLVGLYTVQPLCKIVQQLLQKLDTHLPYDPTIPFLSTYPREMKAYIYTKTCTQIFTAGLLAITKSWKQPKWPRKVKGSQSVVHSHKVILLSDLKSMNYGYMPQHGWNSG